MSHTDVARSIPATIDRRGAYWARALSSLNLRVVALVAGVLFLRTLSTSVEQMVLAASTDTMGRWLWHAFLGYTNLLITASVMLVAIIATMNLGPSRGPKRVVALGAAVVVSAGAGSLLRTAYVTLIWGWDSTLVEMFVYSWLRYAVLGGMLTAVGEFYRAELASKNAAQQAELDRLALESEMTEARLQVLRAQIEPHFLFNTLANVRRLYAEDHGAGRTMLAKLMRYLEVALPCMRRDEATLGRDAELVEAFLHIQRVRMGPRITFDIEIPPQLHAHPVPPMMLLTLVENAIKHGLSRSPKGGHIRIAARAEGDRLLLSVADTGAGFTSGTVAGAGVGLANIRTRLGVQFGSAASLALENNELGGATATIALPLTTSAQIP